jgi:hypothetical protein
MEQIWRFHQTQDAKNVTYHVMVHLGPLWVEVTIKVIYLCILDHVEKDNKWLN